MKLELGKRYVRRDGRLSGILEHTNAEVGQYCFKDPEMRCTYTEEGAYFVCCERPDDLMWEFVEVQESEVTNVPVTDVRTYSMPDTQTDLYPSDAKARKAIPLYSGGVSYFPDSIQFLNEQRADGNMHVGQPFDTYLAGYAKSKDPTFLGYAWQHLVNLHPEGEDGLKRDVAKVSFLGNEQHSPGEPLHWARGKSMDQLDAAMRHEVEFRRGKIVDNKEFPILGQAGWRILAELQLCLEKLNG